MPADYVIDSERRIVHSRAWDTLTDADVFEHQARLPGDPEFEPALNQLFDLQDVTRVELTSEGVGVLAEGNPFGAAAKRAFVVEPGALAVFGMLRMFQILTDEHPDELRVQFDAREDAEVWLAPASD